MSTMQLKDMSSFSVEFWLTKELNAGPENGFPQRYKRESLSPITLGGQRLYPEGTIPIVSDDGKWRAVPEATEIQLCS